MKKIKNRAISLLAIYSLGLFFSLVPNLSFGNVVFHKVCKSKKQLVQQLLSQTEQIQDFVFDQKHSEKQQTSHEDKSEISICLNSFVLANQVAELKKESTTEKVEFHYSQSYQNPDLKNLVNPPKFS